MEMSEIAPLPHRLAQILFHGWQKELRLEWQVASGAERMQHQMASLKAVWLPQSPRHTVVGAFCCL